MNHDHEQLMKAQKTEYAGKDFSEDVYMETFSLALLLLLFRI